jgi:radical SAM-linked protein
VSGPTAPPVVPPAPTVEPRQRWRLIVARDGDAPTAATRELAEAWTTALEEAGLPLARTEGARPRPRVSFGAPLPVGMGANGELIDAILVERWPTWRVRQALDGRLPAGWHLVDLFDVWLAGPPLPGRVAAADYRVTLESPADAAAIARAGAELLAAPQLPRERAKGETTVTYDLRPLLIDVAVEEGPPVVVRTRTRFHPELGTGRPEEVVAALADRLGVVLTARSISRDRLVLVEDLDEGEPRTG